MLRTQSLERLCKRQAIAIGIEHAELTQAPRLADRLALYVGAAAHELRVQRIDVANVEIR